MNHFSYHSEQLYSLFTNGKGRTRRNSVSIRNGKGTKAVEEYSADGKRLHHREKGLTDKELTCIQKGEFIPGLFKDCIKPLTVRKRSSTTRRRHK